MALEKPKRRAKREGKKEVRKDPRPNDLAKAAERAHYVGSPYHKLPGAEMGPPATRRWPHASKCERTWTRESATRALKEAIRAGLVSEEWRGEFPRYVWHVTKEAVYEGILSNQDGGDYHAYPLEDERQWPKGLPLPSRISR